MGNELTVNEATITALDTAAENGLIAQSQASAFQRTFAIANSVNNLRGILTADVMKPIMALQGSRLGFKTDKDTKGGYKLDIVRDCVIEAVMTGVYTVGNQFNIIAGNCYITKEGMGHLLSKIDGLSYAITPRVPTTQGQGAVIIMSIEWTYKGKTETKDLEICVKVNSFMGTDAIIGKATRKARAWLLLNVTGQDVGEGDADDITNEKKKYSANDVLNDLPKEESINVSATEVQEITVEHIVEAVGMSEEDISMHFKLNGKGEWLIQESLSELSQENMQKILNAPANVKSAVEKTKAEA